MKTSFICFSNTRKKRRIRNAPLFSFTDMRDHADPTADIAIARVDRERRREKDKLNRPEPKPKKEYTPHTTVDWHKVLNSKNKRVNINKAWMFKSMFERGLK